MYVEYYGLKDEPFLLTPDPRFYFDSSGHAQALAHLRYGIKRGEGFIVITGEVGAGKTTIVQHLCNTVDTTRVMPAHVVTTLLNGAELIRMFCAEFGIENSTETKDAALLRLRKHLERLHRERRKPVLIVDEAQNLTAGALEELRMISNFNVGRTSSCQIFLIGQPEFRKTLARPDLEQLRQRVTAVYHLGPMNDEECARYVMHRLKQAGWKDDPKFPDAAVLAIYAHTGGIPRRINTLCSRLLLLGYLEDLHAFTAADVLRVATDLAEEYSDISPIDTGQNLGQFDTSSVLSRLESMETRINRQEDSLRHIANGLVKMLDTRRADSD